MPKRHGNLFDKTFTLVTLHAAFQRARLGKRKTSAVLCFERNLGAELEALLAELHSGRYTPRPYRTFQVFEPKQRLIYAPHFRDVVVQHALYAVIYPIFDAGFIHDSYGCRVGKGTHRAADRAQQFLRESPEGSYLLQLDIRKFFYRIDRSILMELIMRKIKCHRTIQLIGAFACYPDPVGIPIGNLMSQLYALIYLNPLDHFIKREMEATRYVRYVDDFVIFGLSQEHANAARVEIEDWLAENLHLELSRWTIQAVSRGLNFVGFRTWRKTRFVRRHSLHTFSRSLARGDVPSLTSIMGHARHTATHAHFCRRLQQERPDLLPALPPALLRRIANAHL